MHRQEFQGIKVRISRWTMTLQAQQERLAIQPVNTMSWEVENEAILQLKHWLWRRMP